MGKEEQDRHVVEMDCLKSKGGEGGARAGADLARGGEDPTSQEHSKIVYIKSV